MFILLLFCFFIFPFFSIEYLTYNILQHSKLENWRIQFLMSRTGYIIHAFPFYKKRSYKQRPIKFFNHKKPWPTEFSIIRNHVLTTREWIFEMFVIQKKKDDKRLMVQLNQIQIRQYWCFYKEKHWGFSEIKRHLHFWKKISEKFKKQRP